MVGKIARALNRSRQFNLRRRSTDPKEGTYLDEDSKLTVDWETSEAVVDEPSKTLENVSSICDLRDILQTTNLEREDVLIDVWGKVVGETVEMLQSVNSICDRS